MLAVETDGALDEPADMPGALVRRVTAVMHDPHRRQICRLRDLVDPHAPIVILEIEEEARIESAGRIDRRAPHEYARTRHRRNANHRVKLIRCDAIAQLVALE